MIRTSNRARLLGDATLCIIHTIRSAQQRLLPCPSIAAAGLLGSVILINATRLLADAQQDIPAPEEVEIPITPEPAKGDTDAHVRVQIFLDERRFGPGKIDGQIGEFTRKAALAYNEVNGIEPLEDWGPLLEAAEKSVPEIYATYTVRKEDLRYVSSGLPYKPSQQAKRRYLGYRSLAEFVSERYHTDERFLRKLNKENIRNIYSLRVGTEVKVPNVTPFLIEDVPKHQRFEEDEALTTHSVIVDTKEKQARFLNSEGTLVASFPITPGQRRFIHYGEWTVQNMVTTPTFRWDKSMLSRGRRSNNYHTLPPGPNNPVGVLWAGISKRGIGLHGTNSPHTIGRSRSAGCIRFANWDAVRLSDYIRPGCKVTIK